MRILMVGNSYKPVIGGIEASMAHFRRGLEEAGCEVHVIAPARQGYQDDEPYVYRVPSVPLPRRREGSLGLPIKALVEFVVRGIQPHLIHSQHPIWMGSLAATLAEDLHLPLVYTYHTRYDAYAPLVTPVLPGLAGRMTGWVVQRYLDRCSHIIAPTASVAALIRTTYSPVAPVSVVPSPIDSAAFSPGDSVAVRRRLGLQDAEILLYCGRLSPEKNLEFLMEAFSLVHRSRPSTRLLLVGAGPAMEGLRARVASLGLAQAVCFTGKVAHQDVPDYAASADLFVFPSYTDTQGLALIEALAAGVPAVALQAPGAADVLAEGGGILVRHDALEFAGAVLALLNDAPCRFALARQARAASARFAIPVATHRLLDVYRQVLAQ